MHYDTIEIHYDLTYLLVPIQSVSCVFMATESGSILTQSSQSFARALNRKPNCGTQILRAVHQVMKMQWCFGSFKVIQDLEEPKTL